MKLCVLVVVFGAVVSSTFAAESYQASCAIQEGNGIRLDPCDASQHLACHSGRCLCQDLGNHLYDYIYVAERSRSKRGLKKKIAVGVAGGAIGFAAGRATAKGASSGGQRKDDLKKVPGCYARVDSPCAMDYSNVNVVTLSTTTTTTTTTTVAPSLNTTADNSTSTTTQTPTTTTTTAPTYDVMKMAKCIRNAVCMRVTSSVTATGGIVKTDSDPRIGRCTCVDGYKGTKEGKCVKSAAGSAILANSSAYLSLLAVILVKMLSL